MSVIPGSETLCSVHSGQVRVMRRRASLTRSWKLRSSRTICDSAMVCLPADPKLLAPRLHRVNRATYARQVDPGREDPAVEVERAPRGPVREPLPPAPVADARGGLAGMASGLGNRGFSAVVARMRDGEGIT